MWLHDQQIVMIHHDLNKEWTWDLICIIRKSFEIFILFKLKFLHSCNFVFSYLGSKRFIRSSPFSKSVLQFLRNSHVLKVCKNRQEYKNCLFVVLLFICCIAWIHPSFGKSVLESIDEEESWKRWRWQWDLNLSLPCQNWRLDHSGNWTRLSIFFSSILLQP